MKKNFVSNSSDSIRMFKSGFLESLSKVSFYVPLIVYIPVIIYLGWSALYAEQMDSLKFIGYIILGLMVWTLTEYILHRFVFHFYPKQTMMVFKTYLFSCFFVYKGRKYIVPFFSKYITKNACGIERNNKSIVSMRC